MNNLAKSKKRSQSIDKTHLWNTFDDEINGGKPVPLECMYRECGNRECCDQCSSMLAFSEEGFLTCVNNKCGIIY